MTASAIEPFAEGVRVTLTSAAGSKRVEARKVILAGDIPGLATGANRLSDALCAALFTADIDTHERNMRAHEDGELRSTSRYVGREQR